MSSVLVPPPTSIHDPMLTNIIRSQWSRIAESARDPLDVLIVTANQIIERHVANIHSAHGTLGGRCPVLLLQGTIDDYVRILYACFPLTPSPLDQLQENLVLVYRSAYFKGVLLFLESQIPTYTRFVETGSAGKGGPEGTNQQTLECYLSLRNSALESIKTLYSQMISA